VTRAIIKRVQQAKKNVWIATPYFIPTWKMRRALKRAAKKGADVRLLLAGPRTDHPPIRHVGRRYYYRLLRNGVRIYEYRPRFIHAKLYLCDKWVSVGSSNLDRWSQRWNLEANQEVIDPDFAKTVHGLFESDFKESDEIDYETWLARPRRRRFLEYFWGTVAMWIEHVTQLKRFRLRHRDQKNGA